MKTHIAILAACVGTLALAQINPTQAAYPGAAESNSAATIANVGSGPAIRLAQKDDHNGQGNRQLVNTTRSNIKHQSIAAPGVLTGTGTKTKH